MFENNIYDAVCLSVPSYIRQFRIYVAEPVSSSPERYVKSAVIFVARRCHGHWHCKYQHLIKYRKDSQYLAFFPRATPGNWASVYVKQCLSYAFLPTTFSIRVSCSRCYVHINTYFITGISTPGPLAMFNMIVLS